MLTKTFWKKAASAVLSIAFAISVVAGVPAVESRALDDWDNITDISNATSEYTNYLYYSVSQVSDENGYGCTHGITEFGVGFGFELTSFTIGCEFNYEFYYENNLLHTGRVTSDSNVLDEELQLSFYQARVDIEDCGMVPGRVPEGVYTFKVYDTDGKLVFINNVEMINPTQVNPTSNHISPLSEGVYYIDGAESSYYFVANWFFGYDNHNYYLFKTLVLNASTGEILSEEILPSSGTIYTGVDIDEGIDYIAIVLDAANNIVTYANPGDYLTQNYSEAELLEVYNRYIADNSDVTAIPNYNIANLSGVEINRAEAEAFVTRNYELVLGRTPDSTGLNNWVNSLVNYQNTGAHVAYGFFFSQEYINSNTSNEEFVTTLYNVFLNRQPDAAGMADWVGQLEAGATREQVFAGVANSREFFNLCVGYGITAGHYVQGVDNTRQQNINAFVARLYGICLGRIGDYDGQASWVRQLINGENSGAGVGYGFFFSPEAQARFGGVPENYVTTMYEVFLGRTPDQAGYNSWVHQLYMGASDMSIFRGFAHSQEYTNICNNYGITRGTV